MSASDSPEVLDVAIVGAGMSGLYSGWRLLRDGRAALGGGGALSVRIFEGSDRVGGRLLSPEPPDMPGTHCELGGMRYMDRHVLVDGLVKRFNLRTEPMPVSEDANIAYLRGQQLRLSELNTPDLLPYRFTPAERHALQEKGGSLLLFALQQIVPDCLALAKSGLPALRKELRTAAFGGSPLYAQGFWNVLARVLSPDAYWFVRDTGGYDCLVSNWNAADAIAFLLADFGADASYARFPDGYDQLPQKLAVEFKDYGGEIRFGQWLRSFDTTTLPDGNAGVALRFADGSEVLAKRLVLAMPRRSLEQLAPTGAVLDPKQAEVRALIESVRPIPLLKIFLCYDHPWWKAVGVETGRTITDLPIRQCFYWEVQEKAPGIDGNACLLASYDDDLSVTFWEGLRRRAPRTMLWAGRRGEAHQTHAEVKSAASSSTEAGEPDHWSDYRAPAAMIAEAHRQIVMMHGVASAPEPIAAAYKDWTEGPYGGGVNFWQIGAKSWEVIPAIVNPRPGVPVYVCGEAYSNEQGWVEGALQTAELMLQDHFGLPKPASAVTR